MLVVARKAASSFWLFLLVGFAALSPPRAHGQSDADPPLPVRFEARAGIVAHGTGNDEHCSDGRVATLGAEARTHGPWILSATADLLVPWGSQICRLVLRSTVFEGDTVGVWGRIDPALDPRAAVHAGREFLAPLLGGLFIEPTIGAGLQFTRMAFGETAGGDSNVWRPWLGGTLTVRPERFGLGVQIEMGRHQLLRRYCPLALGDCRDNGGIIREFTIWRNFFRFGLTYSLN